MKTKRWLAAMAVSLMVLAGAAIARAQESYPESASVDTQGNSQQEEKPQQGVARISVIRGDVSVQRGDSGDWVAATLNQPLVSGDKVSTGDRSRTEIQLNYANVLRLSEHAQANIADLRTGKIQIQLAQGLAYYRVYKGNETDVEIDTPNVSIVPRDDSRFRVEVLGDGETRVVMRRGEAQVSTSQGSTLVKNEEMITVRGSAESAEYKVGDAPFGDEWDSWNKDRDNRIENAKSWRYANHYYTGVDDLDGYGHWEAVPDYGSVWVPDGGPGWAPYREGRWVWEPYYGWTWVSYEPWGWAPYHYGRWFVYGGSWVWWPGPAYYEPAYVPVWSPAYVTFFGFGDGVGFGFGFGNVGWFPVGPCDYFHPWFGRDRDDFRVVNITNVNVTNVNVNNVNVNQPPLPGVAPLKGGSQFSNLRLAQNGDPRVRGGISSMPAQDFGKGRVPPHPAPVTPEQFRGGKMMAGGLPVVPTQQSLRPTDRAVNPHTLPARPEPARFFGKSQPAPARPSFREETQQMEQANQQRMRQLPMNDAKASSMNGKQNGNASQDRGGSENNSTLHQAPMPGAVRPQPVVGHPVTQTEAGSGWSHFGSGRPNSPSSLPPAPGQAMRSGSNSFGNNGPQQNIHVAAPPAPSMPQPTKHNDGWRGFSGAPQSPAPQQQNNSSFGHGNNRYSAPPNNPPQQQNNNSFEHGNTRFGAPAQQDNHPSSGPPQNNNPFGHGNNRPSYNPPLNLNHPIVTPRSSGDGYSNSSHSSPSRGNSGGGSPSGGSYGGASRSSGSYGGGGHSGGGYGGSSRSSGSYGGGGHGGGGSGSSGGSHGGGGGGSHSSSSSSSSSSGGSHHR